MQIYLVLMPRGEITLTGNPNYEEKSQYNLSVVAEDGAGKQSAAQASDAQYQ